jgi:hypothetical protein
VELEHFQRLMLDLMEDLSLLLLLLLGLEVLVVEIIVIPVKQNLDPENDQ